MTPEQILRAVQEITDQWLEGSITSEEAMTAITKLVATE